MQGPEWALPARLPFAVARTGELSLVDRHEIDGLSNIERLVRKYLINEGWDKPLSLAVFGPPGSGKSFTVNQILQSLLGDGDHRPLEFNLSQFQSVSELANAFHQVQDARFSSKSPPLVFFDEFDTSLNREPLAWLKHFLAPMQDGEYREQNDTFRIRRTIFVFAGGIYHTFDDFYSRQRETPEFREAKGPDFVSRLRGHLDIPGINSDGEVSDVLVMRRAILLRSILERICPEIIDEKTRTARIDRGVIRAFLRTRRYEHGVRSMEAIVQMASIPSSRRRFQRSSIPAPTQLAMHVSAEEFVSILAETEIEDARQ